MNCDHLVATALAFFSCLFVAMSVIVGRATHPAPALAAPFTREFADDNCAHYLNAHRSLQRVTLVQPFSDQQWRIIYVVSQSDGVEFLTCSKRRGGGCWAQ